MTNWSCKDLTKVSSLTVLCCRAVELSLPSVKSASTPTTFSPLSRVGGQSIRGGGGEVCVSRLLVQLHTSPTYRRPREGLARMAGRRAAQGRSQSSRGGFGAAAATEGQMHSVGCPQRQMCVLHLPTISTHPGRWAAHIAELKLLKLQTSIVMKCIYQ